MPHSAAAAAMKPPAPPVKASLLRSASNAASTAGVHLSAAPLHEVQTEGS